MNASLTTDPHPPTTAPLALWRVAEAFMHTLHMLFGSPARVAGQHAFTAKAYKLIASWIACGEALLRRLILIEASAYPKPNARPPRAARARHRTRTENSGDPQTWRVSFRCFAGDTHARQQCSQVLHTAQDACVSPTKRTPTWRARFRPSWPIAARYEALIRAFNDPLAYAQRLARRLHAAPLRAHTMLRAPPEGAHRIDQYDALTHRADIAVRGFNSS